MRFVGGTVLINAAVNASCFGIMLRGADWYSGNGLGPVALLVGGGVLGLLGVVLMVHGALLHLHGDNRPMYWPPGGKQ